MVTRCALLALLLAACGGFDNEPLLYGIIRGQLSSASAQALVVVLEHPELQTRPDATGHFEIQHVPLGPATLLIRESDTRARRVEVDVGAAEIVELGVVATEPAAHLELEFFPPTGIPVIDPRVTIDGTPLTGESAEMGRELELTLPAGCYRVVASAKGVGSVTFDEVCVTAGQRVERHVEFPRPDGSPGREGCVVTGCQYPLECSPSERICEL